MITWRTYSDLVSVTVRDSGNVWVKKGNCSLSDGAHGLILEMEGKPEQRVKVDVLSVCARIDSGEWIPKYKQNQNDKI